MAKSPTHKLGQIIGDLLEETLIHYLTPLATKHQLYLDYRHIRKARNNRKEVIWKDINGNSHKLDIVLEKDGSEDVLGTPLAFIEVAWRRYTRHSKNKAQEIQGAILPLVSKYRKSSPFIGAVLAGEFTDNSLVQLKSEGFKVLYFPYEMILNSFSEVGIDVYTDEDSEDAEISDRVEKYSLLSLDDKKTIMRSLIEQNKKELDIFANELDKSLLRKIESVYILPLHGSQCKHESVEAAYEYIQNYDELSSSESLFKYEIIIKYNNGEKITAEFVEKHTTLAFLNDYII